MNYLGFLIFYLSAASLCLAAYEDARCKCVCLDQTGTYNGSKPTKKVYVKAIAADKCTCKIMLGKEDALCPYCDCSYQVRNTTTIKVVVCLILVIISALTLYMVFLQLLEPLLSARRASRKMMVSGESVDARAGSSGSTAGRFARTRWSLDVPRPSWATGSSGSHLPKGAGMAVVWDRTRLSAQQLINAERSTTDESPEKGRLRQRAQKPIIEESSEQGDSPHPVMITGAVIPPGSVSTVVSRVRNQQQRWKGNVEAQRARVFSEHTLLN